MYAQNVFRFNLGDKVKTDLNSLKKELARLTDIDYLRKELNRLANDIKKMQMPLHLNPAARRRLTQLEKRFMQLTKNLASLQKQVDASLTKFRKMATKAGQDASRKIRSSMGMAPVRKTKTSARKAATSAKKAVKKISRAARKTTSRGRRA